MHHSHFNTNNPLAGQLDGVSFWKKVLKKVKTKPNLSDLAASALSLVPVNSESAVLF